MSNVINQTFIIEPAEVFESLSACTGLYTNDITSCSGNTQILLGTDIISFNGTISGETIYASTYMSGNTNIIDIIGGGGGSVITGGTFNSEDGVLSLNKSNNTQIIITGFTDIFTTGATIVGNTIYFNRNDVLSAYTINLNTVLSGITYPVSASFQNNKLRITNNNNTYFETTIDNFSGLTVSGSVSANTFFSGGTNLLDIFDTGGGYIQNLITVGLSGEIDFISIKEAIDSITGATANNRYTISVGPGVYYEDTIIMKPYVNIIGTETSTIIKPNTSSQHIIQGSDFSQLSNCTIDGAGAGYAAIYHNSPSGTSETAFVVRNVIFGNNDTHVYCYGDLGNSTVQVITSRYGGQYQFNRGFYATNNHNSRAARILILQCTSQGTTAPEPTLFAGASGENCEIIMNGVQIRLGTLESNTTFLNVSNGAKARITSVNYKQFDKGIVSSNIGSAPFTEIQSAIAENCNVDISIEHPQTTGSIEGIFDKNKITINSPKTSLVFGDITAGDYVISGALNIRFSPTVTTDVSTELVNASTMGVLSGGTLSNGGNLNLNISGGYGYLHTNDNELGILHKMIWSGGTIVLPDNETNYVFINQSNMISLSNSIPSTDQNILLGRVSTKNNNIEFIDKCKLDSNHYSNASATMFLKGFGAVYASGSLVTEGVIPLTLDVSSGDYFVGTNEFFPSGGTGVTFSAYYQDGSGGHNVVTGTSVDNVYFDNGTGVLSALTSSAYTKHILYVIGDGNDEKYFLVYGQDEYSLLADAEQALLPTPPTYFIDSITEIAAIIVQQGNPNIVRIQDIRPVIGFKAIGITAPALHANLLGLSSDDHKQYILVNGERAFSNNQSFGGNAITDVSSINGVNIENHGSRHLPNGDDPLATDTPVSVSYVNFSGSSNAFSKSDHQHSHGSLSGGTLHSIASSSVDGFMSATDKNYLDGLPTTLNNKANLSGSTFSGAVVAPSISASTYQNLPTDVYTTGGTFSNNILTFTNNTGGTFTVTGITSNNGFTGGTVTGSTIFTNGVTANTISVNILYDSTSSSGSTNQVLTVTNNGQEWKNSNSSGANLYLFYNV